MKSLTVGKRIVLGFALLILIAVALGLVSVFQMSKIGEGARKMAEAYVPEVAVSNNIERNLMLAMYAYRGYQFTEGEDFLKDGRSLLNETLRYIDEAGSLAQQQNLPGLLKAGPEIRNAVESYQGHAKETAVTIQSVQEVRGRMDSSAAMFIGNLSELLHEIEAVVDVKLEERTFKIGTAENVLVHGNNARILNLKAQATGDPALFAEAIDELNTSDDLIDSLRPVTRDADDIAALDDAEESLHNYREDVAAYAAEVERGDAADAAKLDRLQEEMDSAGVAFVSSMEAMVDAQLAKLKTDITEGMRMVARVNDIIDLGNAARINNFKAQALKDTSFTSTGIDNLRKMDPIYEEVRAMTNDPEALTLIGTSKESSDAYRAAMEDYLADSRKLAELNTARIETGTSALEASKSLAQLGIEETSGIAGEAMEKTRSANTLMVVGLVIAAILGIFLAFVITRSIIGPLTRAIADLTNGSTESTSAAEQVSSASQSLAEGASEQASSLEETSSSMEEITSMVAQNAEVAKQTSGHARDASEAANDGVRSMGELRSGANSVNDSAKEMEQAMNEIKQSSDSISKIIKTIDEIAFQTNILALNAAVEAARAGEAGAGFAVVADEVRSLARRAAEAAQETATLIEGSMERSERGVRVNEMVGKNLQDVMAKAETVDNVLKTISDKVNEVSSSMQGLEASVVEQQEGITQINTAVTQVNDVTQTNAASAEEAASAAEEMNAQAVSLMEIVGLLTLMVTGKKVDSAQGSSSSAKANKESSKGGFSLPGD